jgi:hypothetical protein
LYGSRPGNYIQDIREVEKDFFKLCRNIIENELDDTITTSGMINALPFENLPEITSEDCGTEEVDFENTELLELTSNSIRIMAGGDWQDPIEFVAKFENGCLICDHSTVVKSTVSGRSEMTTHQMINALYGTEHPEQLKGRRFPWYESPNKEEEEPI